VKEDAFRRATTTTAGKEIEGHQPACRKIEEGQYEEHQ